MVNVNEAFDARAQRKRSHIGLIILGVLTLAVVILIAAWNWDWFIPIVERQASGAIGRAVTMQHLRVHLARNPVIEVDGLRIANPEGFPQDSALAQVGQLAVTVDAPAYLHTRAIVIPTIELDRAEVDPVQLPTGPTTGP